MYFWSSLIWACNVAFSATVVLFALGEPKVSNVTALSFIGDWGRRGDCGGLSSSASLPPAAINSRALASLSNVLLTAAAEEGPRGGVLYVGKRYDGSGVCARGVSLPFKAGKGGCAANAGLRPDVPCGVRAGDLEPLFSGLQLHAAAVAPRPREGTPSFDIKATRPVARRRLATRHSALPMRPHLSGFGTRPPLGCQFSGRAFG
mmetsp:Transcript_93464/g.147703  ORF Transcript_93464/g.147703 Transcript_93464/m.147703 type:complete len:204 (-) Transcript_93464:8-619(-)